MNRIRKFTVTLAATVVLLAAAAALGTVGTLFAGENHRDNPDMGSTAPGVIFAGENHRDNPDMG